MSSSQATTLQDLIRIQEHHVRLLHGCAIGSAVGLQVRDGAFSDTPAVLAMVPYKVHPKWIPDLKRLPPRLEAPGPDGSPIWAHLDAVQTPPWDLLGCLPSTEPMPETYLRPLAFPRRGSPDALIRNLRGGDDFLGPGSAVASALGITASMGPIVRSRATGALGFLTSLQLLGIHPQSMAIADLLPDAPDTKLYHPLPPSLGPATHVGTVEKVAVKVRQGQGAALSPLPMGTPPALCSTYAEFSPAVGADYTPAFRGLDGAQGPLARVTGLSKPTAVVGKKVVKLGRTSGLTFGQILACHASFPEGNSISPEPLCVDFLVQGENKAQFSLPGDGGAMVAMEVAMNGGGSTWQPLGQVLGEGSTTGVASLLNALDHFSVDLVEPSEAQG